jgi:hypothetical protein
VTDGDLWQSVGGWDDALDALAEELAAQRAALPAGQPTRPPAIEPPAGLGPLPPRLAERARRLLAENQAVTAAVEAALARVERELNALERSAADPPSIPSFVDRRL